MKKNKITTLLILAALMTGSLSACGSSDSSSQKEITSVNAQEEAAESVTDESGDESNDTAVSETESESEVESGSEEDTKETEQNSTSIDEQVVFDQNDVVVTVTKYNEDDLFGDSLQVLIENNSDVPVGVTSDALIINDYMISSYLSSEVAAGKKSNETFDLYTTELEAAGIDNVGQIEMKLHLYDPETFENTAEGELVTLKTNHFEEMDTSASDEGKELYNADGVRIVGKYVDEDSIWGNAIVLFLENNTNQDITVQCDNMSINGFMVYPIFSCTIYSNKKAIDEITILESDLEDNGIESVEEVELVFNILNNDTYETIASSEPITFTAN